jgi:predicted dehydrogenase
VSAVGSHAFNFADFVTGLEVSELSADLTAFVPGRRTPDNAHVMLRYAQGARGMIWISQVAVGQDNGLRLRVYGERGSLFWEQEDPEHLVVNMAGDARKVLVRGGAEFVASQKGLPAGHPQGFIGAFTAFYDACGEQIDALDRGRRPADWSLWLPTMADGVRTVQFADRAAASSAHNAAWTAF